MKHPDLKGSEQHHTLNNRHGEKADRDHAKSDEVLVEDAVKTVKASDADTQIADELRNLTDDK